jgi:TetR/AcrR family transcriptional regulator, transcriptional repressor for nem operon
MGYEKGKLSRDQIIDAGISVILPKGFAATTMADLSQAAHTSAGKLTHHFPTKSSLFEAILGKTLQQFETGPLPMLADLTRSPQARINGFLDGMYKLYAMQRDLVGCPLGHAAGDSDGVSPAMKEQALKLLQRTTALFEKAFRDMKEPTPIARAKANLFINAWQGAVVVARAGDGLEHVRKSFRYLKNIVDLTC